MTSAIVVFVTVPAGPQAKKLARTILNAKSAACVNIVPLVDSHYWWKGKLENGKESLLIIKSSRSKFSKLKSIIRAHHPYTVPEIIALPISAGHQPYLDWIRRETK